MPENNHMFSNTQQGSGSNKQKKTLAAVQLRRRNANLPVLTAPGSPALRTSLLRLLLSFLVHKPK